MQNYKFAMEYLKILVGFVVGILVIWSQIAERRAKQRKMAERLRRQAMESAVEEASDWTADEYEPLSHDNFRPVVPPIPEEGVRATVDLPPGPSDAAEEPAVDVERWRRAIIDSEILKTKF